jgi:hypothetical protein
VAILSTYPSIVTHAPQRLSKMKLNAILSLPTSIALLPGVFAATWSLDAYDWINSPDTDCSSGKLGIDHIIATAGSSGRPCTEVLVSNGISSLHWNSGGAVDQLDSFFVCFYNEYNCPQRSALSTLPEGDTGCTTIPQLEHLDKVWFSVKGSNEGSC